MGVLRAGDIGCPLVSGMGTRSPQISPELTLVWRPLFDCGRHGYGSDLRFCAFPTAKLWARLERGLTPPGLLAVRLRFDDVFGWRISVTFVARTLSSATRWRGQRWP